MYPIWIINCEKHKERWKNMEMEMQKQNITDYQKFKAIEFSNSNLPTDFLNYSLNQIQKLLIGKKHWNWAALGCWYSHTTLWKEVDKPTIIFEDDIVFNPNYNFLQEVEKIVSEVGENNYDCIFFYPNKSYRGNPNTKLKYCNKIESRLFTTFGYLIHPNFIKSLPTLTPNGPIDIQLQYLCMKKNKNFFISKINLIYTDCSMNRSSTIRVNIRREKNQILKINFNKKFFNSVPSYLQFFNVKEFNLIFEGDSILNVLYDNEESKETLNIECLTMDQLNKFIQWAHNGTHSTLL